MNEYLYSVCAFFTFGFSTYNHEASLRFQTGWFYISFLGLIVATNVLILFIDIIFAIRSACKKRIVQKRKDA